MKRTYDYEKKPSQSTIPVQPTASYLQTRGFAPLQTDLDEDAKFRPSGYTENFLEKLINQRSTESSNPPVQRKPHHRLNAIASKHMAIQTKLNIGEPNDKYEQEAGATASKVVQQINSPTQNQSVQRDESMEEDEELQMKSLVQRRESLGGGEASTDLESSIQSARGSGQSLDAGLQTKMGQAMGADFSGVKVHTDSQSDQLNKSIQARAFTTGQDVFFRQGAYNASSKDGQELIAHELTHVVQQNGSVTRKEKLQPKRQKSAETKTVVQASNITIQRAGESYATLKPAQKQEIDTSAKTTYKQEAQKFEENLGNALATHKDSIAGADIILAKLKQIVDTYTQLGYNTVDKQLISTFGTETKDKQSTMGAVKNSADSIKKTLEGGNLREKMTMFYFALRNGQFAAMLEQTFQDLSAAKTADPLDQPAKTKEAEWNKLNLNTKSIEEAQPDIGLNEKSGKRETFNYLKRKDPIQNQDRKSNDNESFNRESAKIKLTPESIASKQQALSYQELKAAFPEEAQALKNKETTKVGNKWKTADSKDRGRDQEQKRILLMQKVAKKKLQWTPGYLNYKIGDKLKKSADDINVLLLGGLSGSTDMYMHAAQHLNLKKPELEKLRLASLGSMLPAKDHSYYEIMYAAKLYGLTDYIEGPKGYETLLPLKPNEIKKLGGINAFPADFLSDEYKNALTAKKYGGLAQQQDQLAGDLPTVASLTAHMGMSKVDSGKSLKYKAILGELSKYEDLMKQKKADPDNFDQQLELTSLGTLETNCQDYISNSKSRLFQAGSKKEKKAIVQSILDRVRTTRLTLMGAPEALVMGLGSQQLPFFHELIQAVSSAKFKLPTDVNENKEVYRTLTTNPSLRKLKSGLGGSKVADSLLAYLVKAYHPTIANSVISEEEKTRLRGVEDLINNVQASIAGKLITGTNRPDDNNANLRYKSTDPKKRDDQKLVNGLFNLAPEEIEALTTYTGGRYAEFNNSKLKSKTIVDLREKAISGLSKLPSYKGPLYRGDYAVDRGEYKIGERFSTPFYSTAKTLEGSFIAGGRSTAYVIIDHKSAKDIEALSQKTWESEALFPPSTFKVVGIVDNRGNKNTKGTLDPANRTLTGATGIPTRYNGKPVDLKFDGAKVNKDNWKTWYSDNFSNKYWVFLSED